MSFYLLYHLLHNFHRNTGGARLPAAARSGGERRLKTTGPGAARRRDPEAQAQLQQALQPAPGRQTRHCGVGDAGERWVLPTSFFLLECCSC